MTVISYPISAYQNVPINAQFFQPSRFVISGVTLGQTTTITTTDDMNYVIGQEIRLIIPFSFGCYQLNGQTGYVISIPSGNQIIVSIDSSVNVSNFKSSPATTVAQIVAIGDLNFGFINQNGNMNQGTYVPGSFINISPL
jgi:hypothetical protein